MSCNGCRVLRKGCSETCILRPCLQWIESAESQGHATIFVAKFFGRAGLMSFISAVPELSRPALFQSLLFEACGRTVNPVNGAVGMLGTGKWHVCQAAVETVLRGGSLRPISDHLKPLSLISSEESSKIHHCRFSTSRSKLSTTEMKESPIQLDLTGPVVNGDRPGSPSEEAETTSCCENGIIGGEYINKRERKLLNLFV